MYFGRYGAHGNWSSIRMGEQYIFDQSGHVLVPEIYEDDEMEMEEYGLKLNKQIKIKCHKLKVK